MAWNFLLGNLIVSAGAFFLLVGSVGLIRLPDFYSRAHATGKSDTLGIILTTLGLVIHEGLTLNSVKLALLLVFVGLTSPTGTHALTRAAFRSGLKPWFAKDAPAPQSCPTDVDHGPADEILEPKEDD
jgi:multicomponent Na+:H+ antiporter subunit G